MLSLIGIVAIVVLTIQVYKAAKNTERNAALWAILNACVGIALQFVIPFIVGFVLAFVWVVQGTTRDPAEIQNRIYGPALVMGIVCLVLSIAGMVVIFKIVSRVPDTPAVSGPPPPPNDFSY